MYAPRFASTHQGYAEIQIAPAEFRGYEAAIWEFTWGRDGFLRAADLGFITPNYGFALYFQSRTVDWDASQPLFEAFQASFQPPPGE